MISYWIYDSNLFMISRYQSNIKEANLFLFVDHLRFCCDDNFAHSRVVFEILINNNSLYKSYICFYYVHTNWPTAQDSNLCRWHQQISSSAATAPDNLQRCLTVQCSDCCSANVFVVHCRPLAFQPVANFLHQFEFRSFSFCFLLSGSRRRDVKQGCDAPEDETEHHTAES